MESGALSKTESLFDGPKKSATSFGASLLRASEACSSHLPSSGPCRPPSWRGWPSAPTLRVTTAKPNLEPGTRAHLLLSAARRRKQPWNRLWEPHIGPTSQKPPSMSDKGSDIRAISKCRRSWWLSSFASMTVRNSKMALWSEPWWRKLP